MYYHNQLCNYNHQQTILMRFIIGIARLTFTWVKVWWGMLSIWWVKIGGWFELTVVKVKWSV